VIDRNRSVNPYALVRDGTGHKAEPNCSSRELGDLLLELGFPRLQGRLTSKQPPPLSTQPMHLGLAPRDLLSNVGDLLAEMLM